MKEKIKELKKQGNIIHKKNEGNMKKIIMGGLITSAILTSSFLVSNSYANNFNSKKISDITQINHNNNKKLDNFINKFQISFKKNSFLNR